MKTYLKNVKAELSHVTWPSSNQAFWSTVAVIILSVGVAYYLGLFDWIFGQLLKLVIS